jgi:hypothetical protein
LLHIFRRRDRLLLIKSHTSNNTMCGTRQQSETSPRGSKWCLVCVYHYRYKQTKGLYSFYTIGVCVCVLPFVRSRSDANGRWTLGSGRGSLLALMDRHIVDIDRRQTLCVE